MNGRVFGLKVSGRDRDIASLRRTQRAATVGRLLLGELDNWEEFIRPETTVFDDIPRRDLKASRSNFRARISKELQKFCNDNFENMTVEKLEKLYLKIIERRGLEMPIGQFESEFAILKARSISGAPRHSTVVISLWGLQTKFPEDMLSKDIIESIRQIRSSDQILDKFRREEHAVLVLQREEVKSVVRTQEFASRTCLLACFNVVEAALNGIAWEFAQDPMLLGAISEKQRKLIEDGTFRDKLIKYPEIITKRSLWDGEDSRVRTFLDQIKPYRDALVHASPFSTPAKYGGLDKLEHIYRIDAERAVEAALVTAQLLEDLFAHVRGMNEPLPGWLAALKSEISPKSAIR